MTTEYKLFIDLQLRYEKNTSSEHVVYKNCFLFWHSKQFLYTTCSELVFFLYWSWESMNNLSSYCGLTDSRMSASDTDLPVLGTSRTISKSTNFWSRARDPYCKWIFLLASIGLSFFRVPWIWYITWMLSIMEGIYFGIVGD